MPVYTNCYWNKYPQQHVTTVPTSIIFHPQLEVNAVIDFHSIPTIVSTTTQEKKAISRQTICLNDSDYDHILEENVRRDKIEFERDVDVYSDDMED